MNLEKTTKKIIELIHGLPYEEAILKELRNEGCLLELGYSHIECGENRDRLLETKGGLVTDNDCMEWTFEEFKGEYFEEDEYYIKILGLPITLSRVMQALNKLAEEWRSDDYEGYFYVDMYGQILDMGDKFSKPIEWKLTDKNGKDLYLEDQAKETQEAISNLILEQ